MLKYIYFIISGITSIIIFYLFKDNGEGEKYLFYLPIFLIGFSFLSSIIIIRYKDLTFFGVGYVLIAGMALWSVCVYGGFLSFGLLVPILGAISAHLINQITFFDVQISTKKNFLFPLIGFISSFIGVFSFWEVYEDYESKSLWLIVPVFLWQISIGYLIVRKEKLILENERNNK